ncbi:hypothetical protein NPIL_124321 [Nephila pilipes]|uniref:Uncharacterized protein n=1 Tax=Nephila pilipes TaxID=299642 RepID=A0A8X6NIY9_NEPPI|nr:hypothetical protein NPIL_124321 [Nephila pilipes]
MQNCHRRLHRHFSKIILTAIQLERGGQSRRAGDLFSFLNGQDLRFFVNPASAIGRNFRAIMNCPSCFPCPPNWPSRLRITPACSFSFRVPLTGPVAFLVFSAGQSLFFVPLADSFFFFVRPADSFPSYVPPADSAPFLVPPTDSVLFLIPLEVPVALFVPLTCIVASVYPQKGDATWSERNSDLKEQYLVSRVGGATHPLRNDFKVIDSFLGIDGFSL